MFSVNVRRVFGDASYWNLSSFTTVLSLSGFDAVSYDATVSQSGFNAYIPAFAFKPQPFSLDLFVKADTPAQLSQRINTIYQAFYLFRRYDRRVLLEISNLATGSTFEVPVLVENITLAKQNGLSAIASIRGIRTTQGIGVSGYTSNPISITTYLNNLPKTVFFTYVHSFPSPLIITLTGPINAGVTLSRSDNLPDFDFSLTVGTAIPSGTSVRINYGGSLLDGNPPVTNIEYLSNPEICPDLVARPLPVTGSGTNTFQITGTSSSGSITLSVERMAWSIYE